MRTALLISLVAAAAVAAAPAFAEAEIEARPEAEAPAPPVAAPPTDIAEQTTPTMAAPPTEMVEEAMPTGRVERATFTTSVIEREPQDSISTLTNDHVRIFYFTELHDLQGHTVMHSWTFNDEVMGQVPIHVGAPRWRAYSSKNLEPSWIGEWTVTVTDESGHVLDTGSFSYVEQTPGVAAPAPAAPAEESASEEAPKPAEAPASPVEAPPPAEPEA